MLRCTCERDHAPVAHVLATKDVVGRKSLLAQTKLIAERTLRHYSQQGVRERMRAIIKEQVAQSQENKKNMDQIKLKGQHVLENDKTKAAGTQESDVPSELEDLIESDREYQKRLRALKLARSQRERDMLAGLNAKNKSAEDAWTKDLLLARVKAKESQVKRLKDVIALAKQLKERRKEQLEAKQRLRKERSEFDELAQAEWAKFLNDTFSQFENDQAQSFEDFMKGWMNQLKSLKDRLARIQGMNATMFGRDARIDALLAQLKRLREKLAAEQALYDKELRMHASNCVNNAHCKLGQKCVDFGCMGVALNSTCATNDDCGNMQVCKNETCIKMEPPAGSPCTGSADCGEGAKCLINKCVLVSTGSRCMSHADCGKGQLCTSRMCQWMRPTEGSPCTKDAAGYDTCPVGQRCNDNNKCGFSADGAPCKTNQDCSAGQSCIGLKCRYFNPPTGSPCTKTEQCAVGHRCVNNQCDLRQSGKVCTKGEDCGFGQRCARGLCRITDRHSPCSNHAECGNGQRCVGTKTAAGPGEKAGKCEGFSSRGRSCSGSNQCPIFFKCHLGKCARVAEHAHCSKRDDCGNHMPCTSFQCVPDWSFRGLKPPRLHACKSQKDCHDTRGCVNGLCVVIPRELGMCKKSKACGNLQSCSAMACVPQYNTGYIQAGGLCKQKEDCANGQFCSKQRCQQKHEGSPCKENGECGLNQQCLANHCISDGVACTSDVHCYISQTCLDGRCTGVALNSRCLTHGDCGNEQLCDLDHKPKQCSKAAPGLGKTCVEDVDCGLGMQCDANKRKCLWVSVGTLCQTDGFILLGTSVIAGESAPPPPCGNGQVCFVDRCVWTLPAEGGGCKTAFDCGTDQTCKGDKKAPSICATIAQGTNCDAHADCGNGQRCDIKKHECVRASETRKRRENPKLRCKSSKECGAREVCSAGQCVGQYQRGQDVPDGSQCASQSTCGFGQKCQADVCRVIPRGSVCKSNAECGNGRQCFKGTCLDTPGGTLCGSRFSNDMVQRPADNKPAAVIGGECGNHQICQFNHCRNLFGGHVATAVAPGTKCAAHSECSFRQRCVNGFCKLLQGQVKCTTNGDCGNGELCTGVRFGHPGLCMVLPEGKQCTKSSTSFDKMDDFVPPAECGTCSACLINARSVRKCDSDTHREKCLVHKGATWCGPPESDDATTDGDMCANGQLCLGGKCHNQFGAVAPTHFARGSNSLTPNALLRAHWVPEGSICSTNYECGAAQVCGDDLHCISVVEGSRCQLTEQCGNGQRCASDTYVCQMEREGGTCHSATDCPKTSGCLNTNCVYQFGHLVGMELARRADEDWTLASEWRAQMGLSIKSALTAIEARQKNTSFDMDMAQKMKGLQDELAKLGGATKTLKIEVARRSKMQLTNSDVEGGGSTCALCVAEQDIQKLVDEIERLKGVLERCKKHPEAYIPSCKQDLAFQITKLKEEVVRRRALLEEEVRQLHEEEVRLQKQLQGCRGRPTGCDQTSEHRLLLQIMKAQDQLYRRKKKKQHDEQLLVLRCLWAARKSPESESIAVEFKMSVEAGCTKIKGKTGTLADCLCKEFWSEKQVREEAQKRVQQANAAWKADTQNQVSEHQRAAAERQEHKDLANQVAKDLLWADFTTKTDWKLLLQKLRDRMKDKVEQLTDKARQQINANQKNAPQSNDQIDLTKLDGCVAPIADSTVRQNIKSTFTEGPARNGCALLSLAKTQVIRTAYNCLCDANNSK